MTDIVILTAEERLSDGFIVHNVILRDQSVGGGGVAAIFQAVSWSDANDLAEKLEAAINEHTVNKAEVR